MRQERRVIVSDMEVQYSLLPLDKLLMMRGIDVAQPYRQIDLPRQHAHLYIQAREVSGHEDTVHG